MIDDWETLRRELEARPTEELASILRDRDEEEWRPEVFDIVASILAARGLSPTEVVAPGSKREEAEEVLEGQQLVTIGRSLSPVEVQAQRMVLEAAGLRAWVCDETVGAWYGVAVGSRLQVRAEDEAAARSVLDAEPAPASAMPLDLAESPCPRCGSSEVSQTAEVLESPPRPTEGPRPLRRFECGSCGHAWSDSAQGVECQGSW